MQFSTKIFVHRTILVSKHTGRATNPMLGGSLVTMAWRILRLRMEETPSNFGG
jgi:hypothetical protein